MVLLNNNLIAAFGNKGVNTDEFSYYYTVPILLADCLVTRTVSVLVIIKQPGQSYVNKTVDSLLPFVYDFFTSESSHKFQQQHGPLSVNAYDVVEKG